MAMFLLFLAGLLLSSGVSGNDDAIKTACTGTPYPEYCESQLSASSKSAYASVPPVLAVQVAARVFVKGSQDAGSLINIETELPAAEEECVVDCQGAIRVAVELLQNASDKYPERAAVLADARAYLAATAKDKLRTRWNCGRCLDKTKKTPPPNDLDKITDTVSSLIDRDAADADDNVDKACADTPYPEMCVSILSVFQGSKGADASVLAGLAIHAAPVLLDRAVTGALTRQNDQFVTNATVSCFKECQAKMAGALDVLRAASPDEEAPGNGTRLADVRSFLDKAKADHVAWHCDVCRPDKKVQDAVSEGNTLDMLMAILPVLLNHVASK